VLLEGLQQEVEQRRPGLRLDLAPQGGDRGPVTLDQLVTIAGSVSISAGAPKTTDARPGVGDP
jgi:hypothetical protein